MSGHWGTEVFGAQGVVRGGGVPTGRGCRLPGEQEPRPLRLPWASCVVSVSILSLLCFKRCSTEAPGPAAPDCFAFFVLNDIFFP